MTAYTHRHEIDNNPETNDKLSKIVSRIKSTGWAGLPLLACGDQLLTGCHRATACEILGVEPEVHQAKITANWDDHYYLLSDLADASNDDSILSALRALLDEGLVDQESVDIMQAEVNKD